MNNKFNTNSILKTCIHNISDELKKEEIKMNITDNIIKPLIYNVMEKYNCYYYSFIFLLTIIILLLVIIFILLFHIICSLNKHIISHDMFIK